MQEDELVDALEEASRRVGVRPVLEVLVDWIGRGFWLEVFADLSEREGVSRG